MEVLASEIRRGTFPDGVLHSNKNGSSHARLLTNVDINQR